MKPPEQLAADHRMHLAAVDVDVAKHGSNRAGLYIFAVVFLSVVAVASITTVSLVRPERDNSSLISTIIGFTLPTITALLGMALQQIGTAMDGRMSQLMLLNQRWARLEGQKEGVAAATATPASAALPPVIVDRRVTMPTGSAEKEKPLTP
jgi:hypothetical protein